MNPQLLYTTSARDSSLYEMLPNLPSRRDVPRAIDRSETSLRLETIMGLRRRVIRILPTSACSTTVFPAPRTPEVPFPPE
jgi:hypothetical protein